VKCVHVATPHSPSPHTYIQAMHEREQRRCFKHALIEVCWRVCECESEFVCASCIHTCMFIHVCTYMYVCSSMYVHTWMFIHVCSYMYEHT
jgi:hypothetical protein